MRLAAIATLTVALSVPLSAGAVSVLYSYSGSDYSRNDSTGKVITACDREADDHAVKAQFYRSGSSSQYEVVNKGGVGSCAEQSSPSVVYKHRIVEIVSYLRHDDYGPWVYPS